MLVRSIQLNNFLSYGEESSPIELGKLNVIIGPNGSGKSNLIDALNVLRSAPQDLRAPIRGEQSSVRDWLWKGARGDAPFPTAKIEAVVENPNGASPLRVDSECAIDLTSVQQGLPETWKPWTHLARRKGDEWTRPTQAKDDDCHLMVQCMEVWLLADQKTLADFYGQGFKRHHLPKAGTNLENVPKKDIYSILARATKDCEFKGKYDKGGHSFDLLARIDPKLVETASPWAKRLLDALRQRASGAIQRK